MRLKRFNESVVKEFDSIIDKIRSILIEYEDTESVIYQLYRVHYTGGNSIRKDQQIGGVLKIGGDYSTWLENSQREINYIKDQKWFIDSVEKGRLTFCLLSEITIEGKDVGYPSGIEDVHLIEDVLVAIKRLQDEFDKVSISFEEVGDFSGREYNQKTLVKIRTYFSLFEI
jgi:hypothetical protein